MKWFDGSKIRLLLIGFLAALLAGGGSAKADFTFGTATNAGLTINTGGTESRPGISADGLTLYFCSNRGGGYGDYDIYVATRATTDDEWGPPVNLGPNVNSSARDNEPDVSADGLTLYFTSGGEIWVATRTTTEDDWGPRVKLGPTVNSSGGNYGPSISADGLELFFTSDRPGGSGNSDLWVTTRETTQDDWGQPINLGPTINSSVQDQSPSISGDGLRLYFDCGPDGSGDWDLWVTTRATKSDLWGEPVNLGPAVNSSSWDCAPSISDDGSTLVFWSSRPGGFGLSDIWQVSIAPIVDFNGDGQVNLEDFSKLAQHWGQDERSVDMGPMPWGNGIVDVQDLAVLAENWLGGLPRLVAHWKLDETQGFIAHDSAGDHDATVHGNAAWQPDAGMVDGALLFDGIDDYVNTPFVLNPAQGSFSVFVWVKGEVPGQVVLSQVGGVNWFYTLLPMGWLMTNLGQHGAALLSQTVITDGQWHRIGFTWDGTNRTLYVDDIEAAKDTQTGLPGSNGGLHFGAGANLEAGTFFSGLIDDVKIYDRAVTP